MSSNPSILIYKRLVTKSADVYTYSGPIYVESINVIKENVISKKYEKITEKGSKSLIGLIMFIICSIFSILFFIFAIKSKTCEYNIIIPILIILISIVSIILNSLTLKPKRKVKAYYLENEFVSTTDKVVPVIANMEERYGSRINIIFIILSIIYVVVTILLFRFINKCVI